MSVVKSRLVLLLVGAVGAAACGGNNNVTPTAPVTPAQSIVENFTGTLTPFSARTHTFQSNNAGDVIVQVTTLDPADTVVGLSVGTSNTFACQTSLSTEQATLGSGLTGVARASGTLCVHIYDPSDAGLPAPVTYTLQVTHF
jgi:xanthine/uracil/vitamin C permease (AzgA family)